MTDVSYTERCDDCPMRTHGILRGTPQKTLDRMSCCMATYRFPARHVIALEGNPCRQVGSVRSGRVKLSKCGENGRVQIVGAAGVGFVLGYEGFLGRPFQSTAEALTDVEICMASHQDILQQMADCPELAKGLVTFLCHRIQELEHKALQLGTLSTRQRLAAYLLSMGSNDNGSEPTTPDQPPLTRQEIAEMLGMAKETLIRLLARFEQQNMIKLEGPNVVVKDPARLRHVLSATH